ncbi:hypothetical protein ACVWZK_008440 [Bradyrhizobium sp. GM0.4]
MASEIARTGLAGRSMWPSNAEWSVRSGRTAKPLISTNLIGPPGR